MYCFKLTNEEIRRGELIFGQLEKEVFEPTSFGELKSDVLLLCQIIEDEWKECVWYKKVGYLLFWWPIYYVIFSLMHIIIC